MSGALVEIGVSSREPLLARFPLASTRGYYNVVVSNSAIGYHSSANDYEGKTRENPCGIV